jgi:Fur family ferric uptake transcriptional regulator
MRSPDDLRRHLRANGRKVTPQRELVAALLRGNDRHPTAEALHEAASATMPSLSLKTVYLVLRELEGLGEVRSITVVGGATRFDPNTDQHQHLVCSACGLVLDVVVTEPLPAVPRTQLGGFRVERADVFFRGRCSQCEPGEPSDPATGTRSRSTPHTP